MLTPFHKMHGLTLMEVMIAVVILGLLMALGAGSFTTWTQNQQTRTAAESILNGIQLARGEAVKRNGYVMFFLCDVAAGGAKPGSSWDILAASASAAATDTPCSAASGVAGWERVQRRDKQEGSRFVEVYASGVANVNTIAFNGFGRVATVPNASLPTSTFAIIQSINSVTAFNRNGDRPLQVTVMPGGSVRMCDPSPLLAANDPRHC